MLARIVMTTAAALVAEGVGWGQWIATEEAKLLASDGANGDVFGYSVSVSGDTILIGADGDNDYTGSAYVFVRSGTIWTEQAKLTASDIEALDFFGWSVSISGDTALVGASFDDHLAGAEAGSAYVFVRSGTNWMQQAKLVASDAAAGDRFGSSVCLSSDTAVIGAFWDDHAGGVNAGSTYVFVRNGTSWTEQAKLTASDAYAGDEFGVSVSTSGDTIVVGADGDTHADDSGFFEAHEGSTYVFVRNGTGWTQQAKLIASDAASLDAFGYSTSISGDTAVVGAWGDDVGSMSGSTEGSAYVFVRSGITWSEQAKLIASDGTSLDDFGYSVSLSGDTALIGARGDDNGSAYVFARSGARWSEQAKVTVSTSLPCLFGWSVALEGSTAVIGAPDDYVNMLQTGSAYVFHISPTVNYCTAGTSASGCQALLSAAGTPSASAPSGFTLQAATVEGQKDGLFFFGTNGKQANPWGSSSSFQCVVPPVVRTQLLTGTGTNGLCDGTFSLDLNAVWTNQPAKNPGPGAAVQAQVWYRDPLSTSNQTTSLSDAIEFVVGQ